MARDREAGENGGDRGIARIRAEAHEGESGENSEGKKLQQRERAR